MNNSKWVTTRKTHRCFGCCEGFGISSYLRYCWGKFDGEFYSVYYCKKCDDFIQSNREDFEDGIFEGDVREAMNEMD